MKYLLILMAKKLEIKWPKNFTILDPSGFREPSGIKANKMMHSHKV